MDADLDRVATLLDQCVEPLPEEKANHRFALYEELDAQETREVKLFETLDKLEAVICYLAQRVVYQYMVKNEYELNKTYELIR